MKRKNSKGNDAIGASEERRVNIKKQIELYTPFKDQNKLYYNITQTFKRPHRRKTV